MNLRMGSWLYSLFMADRLSGIERVNLEFHKCIDTLIDSKDSFHGVLPSNVEIPVGFPKYSEISEDRLIKEKSVPLDCVNVLWMNSLNFFGFNEIRKAKLAGLKVVTPIFDLFPVSNPNLFFESANRAFKIWLMHVTQLSNLLIFTSKSQIVLKASE